VPEPHGQGGPHARAGLSLAVRGQRTHQLTREPVTGEGLVWW
jgi:hypothetical protein